MSSAEKDQGQDPYGAIKFGEFRKYMQNKQSKLKKQQKELGEQASQELEPIFKGTSIYINGYTDPPSSDLRRMILQHGGDYQHYLKKISVTHIIATNLTNSKLEEFRAYKVVKPNWITESVEKNQLQPWQNYRLVPRATTQKELLFTTATTTTEDGEPAEKQEQEDQEVQQQQQKEAKLTGKELNANLLSNDWARSVSTANPEFIKRYYETSRLHYLSTWKAELKEIVEKLEGKYPNEKKKKRNTAETTGGRVVMHIDFDCFFASVGIRDRPWLRDKPVAVSHSKGASEASSSDIASCNYVARSFGVRNGITIGSAKALCPELQVVPYEFEKYRSISEIFYEIVFQYADEMQAVSVDEALLEVGSHFTKEQSQGQEEQVETMVTKIRDEIRQATGCEASVGIGSNILLARLSTKRAKPAGQYFCHTKQDVEDLLANTSVIDLPGVGYAISEKLEAMNIKSIGDVKKLPLYQLQEKLGTKIGQTLYNFSRGIDDRPLLTNQLRQSVSAEVNWGMRFESEENEKEFVEGLSKEVADRLNKHDVKGKTITVKILKRKEDAAQALKSLGHGRVDAFSKSYTTSEYTADPTVINKHVYSMLKSFHFSCADIRGLGITITRLNNVQEAISPDQGKLKFTARFAPIAESATMQNEQEQQQQLDLSKPAAASANGGGHPPQQQRRQGQKGEMTVDYNVYRELPESVQQELMSNYILKFQNRDKGKGKAIDTDPVVVEQLATSIMDSQQQQQNEANSLSIPELPPWSQLDPASLLALPEKMRAQVLEAYGNKGTTTSKKSLTLSPPRSNQQQIKRKTPSSSSSSSGSGSGGNNKRNRTITQLFQRQQQSPMTTPKRTRPLLEEEMEQEGLGYEVNVWNELPLEMRTEILAEHRFQQNKQKQLLIKDQKPPSTTTTNQEQQKKRTEDNDATIQQVNAHLLNQIPSLQGYTDIGDLRRLLKEWVTTCTVPEEQDVLTVSDFLVKLVEASDLEKVHLLVVYLNYLIQGLEKWQTYQQVIQEKVSDCMISIYGYPLKF